MADILIRGMEIPKNCSSCKIVCWNYLEYGINGLLAKLSASESRAPNCPLVPLPEGHGRLIDEDALRKAMYHEAFETDSPMQKWESGCWIRYRLFERNLEIVPTIVPAEGGTDECSEN